MTEFLFILFIFIAYDLGRHNRKRRKRVFVVTQVFLFTVKEKTNISAVTNVIEADTPNEAVNKFKDNYQELFKSNSVQGELQCCEVK